MNDKPFPGSEQFIRNDQGANGIVASAAAGVTDDVGIAFGQTRKLRRVKTGVHTSQHGKMPGGWYAQFCFFTESCRVTLIRGKDFIKYLAHIVVGWGSTEWVLLKRELARG